MTEAIETNPLPPSQPGRDRRTGGLGTLAALGKHPLLPLLGGVVAVAVGGYSFAVALHSTHLQAMNDRISGLNSRVDELRPGLLVPQIVLEPAFVKLTEDRLTPLIRESEAFRQQVADLVAVKVAPLVKAPDVPVGVVAGWPFDATSLPQGWLLCDGEDYRASDYPALYRHLKLLNLPYNRPATKDGEFNVPDYRGYFLRGLDRPAKNPANRDPDSATRGVGDVQNDMVVVHGHGQVWGGATGRAEVADGSSKPVVIDVERAVLGPTTLRQNGAPEVLSGPETRPKNVAINWIIYAGSQR